MIIGVDPGLSGAIAFIWAAGTPSVHDLPVTGKLLDFNELRGIVCEEIAGRVSTDVEAYVESPVVRISGGQVGSKSAFTMGDTAGVIRSVFASLEIQMHYVTAGKWKKRYALNGKDKEMSRALAVRLFPECREMLRRKKDHGLAEALLIARYGIETGVRV